MKSCGLAVGQKSINRKGRKGLRKERKEKKTYTTLSAVAFFDHRIRQLAEKAVAEAEVHRETQLVPQSGRGSQRKKHSVTQSKICKISVAPLRRCAVAPFKTYSNSFGTPQIILKTVSVELFLY